jgi:hypothetical protein
VLYSTTRPERIRDAAAVSHGDLTTEDPSLEKFRELVRSLIEASDPTTEERP